jgi:hypothetical protein
MTSLASTSRRGDVRAAIWLAALASGLGGKPSTCLVVLLAFDLVATFLCPILPNRLGVLQLPDVRQQFVKVGAPGQ